MPQPFLPIQPSNDHRATALSMAYAIASDLKPDGGKSVTKEDLMERAKLVNQIAVQLLQGMHAHA